MTTEQKIIRAKVGLLELAKQLGNVSQACKMMGYSRDSFYRVRPAPTRSLATNCAPSAGCNENRSQNRPSCSRRNPFTTAGFARMIERAGGGRGGCASVAIQAHRLGSAQIHALVPGRKRMLVLPLSSM